MAVKCLTVQYMIKPLMAFENVSQFFLCNTVISNVTSLQYKLSLSQMFEKI